MSGVTRTSFRAWRLVVLCSLLLGLPLAVRADVPGPGQETPDPGETAIVAEMLALIKAVSHKRTGDARLLRFNQAKSLGCFDASFDVADNLPPQLAQGLFAQSGRHSAMVRFANAQSMDDRDKDLRGLSIKVYDVMGEPLWGVPGIQDFVLNSHPALFADNPMTFLKFIRALDEDSLWWFFVNPFDSHFKALWILWQARAEHHNPFALPYFSTTPFRHGIDPTVAVKYAVKPCPSSGQGEAAEGVDRLSEAMHRQLTQGPVCFDFLVQFQGDPAAMPIEDASVIWDETQSPFAPVARLTIAQQPFRDPTARQRCERASFNPWQGLPAHRPLGGINRVRKEIYEVMARYRNQVNKPDSGG